MTAADNPSDQFPGTPSRRPAKILPVISLHSRGPLPALPEIPPPGSELPSRGFPKATGVSLASPQSVNIGGQTFWLDSGVLMCACPDCSAPMSVRQWLMAADCWRCPTSIELTEEQERGVRSMLAGHVTESIGDVAAAPSAAPRQDALVPALPARSARQQPTEVEVQAPPLQTTLEPTPPPRIVPGPSRRSQTRRRTPRRSTQWINNTPAWLISLVFHVILLTILGLLTGERTDGPYITLSTRLSRFVQTGGDTRLIAPDDNSVFDLGVPESANMEDPAVRKAVFRADQDARHLRLTDANNPYLPALDSIKDNIRYPTRQALAVRDPRVRIDMVRREGGTTLTEAAVARGLSWLERHQNEDGSWSLDRFHQAGRCRCDGRGKLSSDSAGTSLALLPFLGAGQTHLTGIYKDTVARALRWLLRQQKENGDLRGSSRQYPGMYAHGQGAIVLCEAYLMTGDEELRESAQRAVEFIAAGQYADGGWRYYPLQEARKPQGDTSVLGWQLMALQSALAAGLVVPQETLDHANRFLDQVQHADGALYGYLPKEDHSAPMTAEGLLCRVYLGWKENHAGLREGVRWMLDEHPPDPNAPDIYYWYYATQVMHHYGGRDWERWNLQMQDVLVATQDTRGDAAGSWPPEGPLTSQGGRVYMTALAICCLEVYYRHLPLFRQIDLQ